MPSPREQQQEPSLGELERECSLGEPEWECSLGELELGCSLGELGLWQGLRQGEDPEDHHTRHVTGLLPHLARSRCRQRGLGTLLHLHPARSACLQGPRHP